MRVAIEAAAPSPASATQARTALVDHVTNFMARTLSWHEAPEGTRQPEHGGLKVEVGTGKTVITCQALPGFIAEARARGVPYRVLFTVPTHKLGGEITLRLASLGLNHATWRGREAENPASGEPMCADLPAVRDAVTSGEEVESAVCGKPDAVRCRHFDGCPYQAQKAVTAAADVVIGAHELMLGRLPHAIGKGFALTIADESWLQTGVEARVLAAETLRAGEIEHPVPRHDDATRRDDLATNDLHVVRRKLANAVDQSPDGYLSRKALVTAGLSSSDCHDAHRLEWRRKVAGVMLPGMSVDARRHAMHRLAGNVSIRRLAALWKAAAALLDGEGEFTGRVELGHRETPEGSQRVIVLNTVRAVADAVAALPMLILDAALPAKLLQHRLPGLTVLAEIEAAAPHMQVHQVRGGFGKTSVVPNPKADDAENRRRRNRIGELRDYVALRSGGAPALIVTYKAIEPDFTDLPGVTTAHFNAISGCDQWRDVRHLFVIGRPMPAPNDTRRIAAALTGEPVPAELPGLVTRDVSMRTGAKTSIEVRAYTDPDLEAVRAAITDAEMIQVIGRGRGINRTAATPLDVHVLAGDVALPLPLATLTRWQDVAPNLVQRMGARGVVLTSARDATHAYPDLFNAGEDAARQALLRATQAGYFRDIPLWIFTIGECHANQPWVRVEYRPAGRGQRTRIAWVRPDRLPGLRSWLEAITEAEVTISVAPAAAPDHPPAPPVEPEPTPPPASKTLTLQRLALRNLADRLEAMRPPDHPEIEVNNRPVPDDPIPAHSLARWPDDAANGQWGPS